MVFVYTVQMLGKKWRFWSWGLWHWTIKALHIWFLHDWLIKCKETLCFLPLFTCYRVWVEGGLEVVWTKMRVMSQCPTALLQGRLGCVQPFCQPVLLISLQREGTWLLNMLHASTPCSQLLSNPAHQNFPGVAATASHYRQGWVSWYGGSVPPRTARQSGVGMSTQSSRKIPGPPSLIPPAFLGLGHARISHSCCPSHTCAMGTNGVCTGKN